MADEEGVAAPGMRVQALLNAVRNSGPFASLRVRVLLLILLALIPAALLMVYSASEERRHYIADAQAESLAMARRASADETRLIGEIGNLLMILARLPEVRDAQSEACSAFMADLIKQHPDYANLAVINMDGSVSCSAILVPANVNLHDRTYFQRAIETRDLAAGEYQVGRITGKPVVAFGYPIMDDREQVKGVVFASIDLSWLNQLAAESDLPPGSSLTVFDRKGTVLARYPDPDEWVGKSVANVPAVKTMSQRQEGVIEGLGIDGVPRVLGFTTLRTGGQDAAVHVSVGIPEAMAVAGADWVLKRNLASLGILGALVLVATWAAGNRLILQPIRAMVAATRRLSKGDLSARTGLPHGKGELRQLAHAFDEMAETLGQRAEQLKTSEERFRSLFENAVLGLYRTTPDGRIDLANPALVHMLGFSSFEELAQRNLEKRGYVLKYDRAAFKERIEKEGQIIGLEAGWARRDGTTVYVRESARAVRDGAGRTLYYEGTVEDITERRQAEEKLRRYAQRLEALHEIDAAITANRDLRRTLDVFLEKTLSLLQVDAAGVLLLNPSSQILEYAAGRGLRTAALQHARLRLGEGHAGLAALKRCIVSIPNLENTPGQFVRATLLAEEQFVSYYAAPLVAKDQVKGVLEIFNRTLMDPTPEWLNTATLLAGQAAIAIDNATLFDDLQRSSAELASAYDDTIEGWSRALDLRDRETEGHSQRVADMTLKLARLMGVEEDELVHMRRGALLHDIGKMAIPDSILLKPGPLTDDEWKVMHMHPSYAHELLSPIEYLHPALDIPYCHHERWDGDGYPRGLRGEDIPLAARIFAVVDVWDALRSRRPYRPAWSEQEVLDHIRSLSGSHFDPAVLEAFLLVQSKVRS